MSGQDSPRDFPQDLPRDEGAADGCGAPEIGPYAKGPEHSGFSVDAIDTSKAHPARLNDYYLGGWDNYEVDREAGDRVLAMHPQVRESAVANRAFLGRALRELVGGGIRQVIDIGTGIPTSPNAHEIAREVAPDTAVVYVDNDPIVATHAGARLTNAERTAFVLADLRDPKAILDHPDVRALIDFEQPVALVMCIVLTFLRDEDDPAACVAAFADALPAGSHLVLTHSTYEPYEGYAEGRVEEWKRTAVEEVYQGSAAPLHLRSRAEVTSLFGPFTLLEPGVVRVPLWRPDGEVPGPAELNDIVFYGGVGRKD
ncbi:SAM-dependent methyltransferase [Streptomyces chattanoogensis]|uniref:SAM-dependent methyltransferase n=1 Tax=Streptomyces chattanoogensis TaxID=66876 RepID=UPI0036736AF2